MLVLTADHTIRMGLTERHLKRQVRYRKIMQEMKQKRTAEDLAVFGQNRRAQGLVYFLIARVTQFVLTRGRDAGASGFGGSTIIAKV